MGDPVTIAIVASTAVSAYGAVQSGKYAQAAAEAEAAQYEQEKRMAGLKAIEDSNARKRDLIRTEAANKAAFAAKTGTDPYESASFLALRESNKIEADRDLGAIRLMGAAEQNKYALSSWNARVSGKASAQAGYTKAASTLLGGYVDYKRA